jgi:hypothetical protein
MTDKKYEFYFPNMNEKRKNLFKNFYKIEFHNDLPVTIKNRKSVGFHPLISSYVLRHILWEILNCPRGNGFGKITEYNINKNMYEKSINIFNSVYLEGIKSKYIFAYDDSYSTGNKASPYSGLTNAKMLYIYSYYNLIKEDEKYTKFCNDILDSLVLDIKNNGCSILLAENQLWIDEEANYPNFILNGFLSIIRNLIDLIICIENPRINNILSQNKNIIENLLPLFDSEKYKTSKYRLCTYGQIILKIKSNKNIKLDYKNVKINLIYNNKYKYLVKYSKNVNKYNTFQNIFNIVDNNIHINFIYSEVFTNVIELTLIDNSFDIIDSSISCFNYVNKNTYKQRTNFKRIRLNYTKTDKKILIKLNKNLTDYFLPSITYFTKKYNNNLYNVYHYNHIDNLRYINKYFQSDIINTYVNKWDKYTKEWNKMKIYNQLNNINFSRIN